MQILNLNPLVVICSIGWQTWLDTGLFITTHDAMHKSIHASPKLNQAIGQLCLWLYAGFDYSQLSLQHHLHHQHPASDRDPDFHDGKNQDFWPWYWQFVREHHQPPQLPWW